MNSLLNAVFSRLLAAGLRRAGADAPDLEAKNYLAWLQKQTLLFRWGAKLSLFGRLLRSALRPRRVWRWVAGRVPTLARVNADLAWVSPLLSTIPIGSDPLALPTYFFKPAEIEALTRYARERWPDQVRGLITWADKLRNRQFPLVSGLEADFSGGVEWDSPFHDTEHLFYLNRFSYAPVLAKAYLYSRDHAHLDTLATLLEDWGKANPPGRPRIWESYSVAERICNWTHTAYLLQSAPAIREFLSSWLFPQIAQHAAFLADHLETATGHNHLINDARALLVYGLCFSRFPHAERCRELGWDIICREMPRQTLADGVFREQSTHYHLLLTRTFTEAFCLARSHGLRIPDSIMSLLETMHEAMAHMIRPDGSIPYVGDICPDIESRYLVGLLAVGAVLFGRPEFKRPEAFNEHAVWYLGLDGLKHYDELPSRMQSTWARNFPHGGFAFLGYREDGRSVHASLHADPAGRVMFHGDMDPLGLDVWINDRCVIRDTGNYSYNPDRWLGYFKSARAQNTVLVDDLPPWLSPPAHRWLSSTYCAVQVGTTVDGPTSATAWHTGYRRLPMPVALRRRVALYPPEGVVVTDAVEGIGVHTVDLLFQLGPDRAELRGDRVALFAEDASDVVWIWPRSRNGVTLELIDGWVATGYGVKSPSRVVRVRARGEVPVQVETIISSDPLALLRNGQVGQLACREYP